MAIAPWFRHQRLLSAAIRKAAPVLKAPIDRIEAASDQILIQAGTKELTICFQYVANPSPSLGASPQLLLDGEEPSGSDAAPRAGQAALPRWREREELLHAAISKATPLLIASINRIEVTADQVLLRAGSMELAISYRFVKNPNGWLKPRGFLLDGQDYWECFK